MIPEGKILDYRQRADIQEKQSPITSCPQGLCEVLCDCSGILVRTGLENAPTKTPGPIL